MIRRHAHRRSTTARARDAGSVLPLTLVLTVVFAMVVAAIGTYSATALRSTQTTEGRVDRLAAAESALQEALMHLQATGACPTSVADRNGVSVEISGCDVQHVALFDGDRPFGLILTALGLGPNTNAFTRSSSAARTIEIGGEVYIALTVTAPDPRNVGVTGHVISQATECPGSGRLTGPTWLGLEDSECTELPWNHFTSVPAIPSVSGNTVPTTPGCTVIGPGTYNGTTNVSGNAYFASGVYRIRGELRLNGRITAGHHGHPTLPASNPCHAAQIADIQAAENGGTTGAVFVLENNGWISVRGNGTDVQFNGLRAGNRVLGLVAYTTDFPAPSGGFLTSSRDPDRGNQPIILKPTQGSPNAAFSFRGEVWASRGHVDIQQMSSSGAEGAAFLGGTTISRFGVSTSASVDGLIIGLGEVESQAYHRVRVTASSPNGGSTTVSAVARELPDDGIQVMTWRVCGSIDCRS